MKTIPKFEFQTYTQKVDIAGQKFDLDCSQKTLEAMSASSVTLRNLEQELQSGKPVEADALRLYHSCMDRMLGADAWNRIFSKRGENFDDANDLFIFLISVIRAHRDERAHSIQGAASADVIE